jgi:ABC-2 type transport system permease protein/lipopolysaccharide transport system permease protein
MELVGWRRLSPAFWAAEIARDLRLVYRFRHVLGVLVANQLKVRYQRSALGFLWTLINPILMLSVLAVFMSQVLRMEITGYAAYLFAGLVPWQFFAAVISTGSRSLIASENLIRKVNVPKVVFPLAESLVAAVNMAFALSALAILLQFVRPSLYVQLVLLPVGLAMYWLFTFGLALTTMTLVTYFRDCEHILQVLLQALYFCCPILYMPRQVGKFAFLLDFNPITHYMAFTQAAFYYGQWPTARNWMVAAGCAAASMLLGYFVYKTYEHDYIYRL